MPTECCRFIKVDGLRCRSEAIRGQALCYFHRTVNARRRALVPARPAEPAIIHPLNTDGDRQREPIIAQPGPKPPLELDFPFLEDRESIQVAISTLVSALARNSIDIKRASVLLYGLQVASSNVRDVCFSDLGNSVTRTVMGPDGTELAPDEDPEDIIAQRENDGDNAEDDEEED